LPEAGVAAGDGRAGGAPGGGAAAEAARFVAGLRLGDVPQEVVQHALLVVRDTLGVLVGGSRQPENAAAARMAVGLGGPGRSSVAGASEGTSAHVAAMLNATSAVTLELDEGNQFALNHPAIHVLPAALAVAEEVGATSAQFLEAFLCGYEVAVRFGAATRLRDQVHPFGTTAVVGAAAAGGKLHGLSEEELRGCLLLAAGTAIASSQTAANSGASVRNLAAGLTAHNGVLAVALHRAGFTGEERVFDRVFGEILGTEWREEDVAFGQDDFFITRNYFKLHACSRWNHAPIEAAGAGIAMGPESVAFRCNLVAVAGGLIQELAHAPGADVRRAGRVRRAGGLELQQLRLLEVVGVGPVPTHVAHVLPRGARLDVHRREL